MAEKIEVFEEETHLEQVDLLSNVPLTQPNVLEEETLDHVDDVRVGEDYEDDEDKDWSHKSEAVLSHDLAQEHQLEDSILEPNEESEEYCQVAEAVKQLENEDHETIEPVGDDDDDEGLSDKFEVVSKHELEQEHQLEKDDNKLSESSEPEVEDSCHMTDSLTRLESENPSVYHHEEHLKEDEKDKELNQSDNKKLSESFEPEVEESCYMADSLTRLESEHCQTPSVHEQHVEEEEEELLDQSDEEKQEDSKQQFQQNKDILSEGVLLEYKHHETKSEPRQDLEDEALQNRISPTQHSPHDKDDDDFDKLSDHSSINDKPKNIKDEEEEEEEPLSSLTTSEKPVSDEASLEKEDKEENHAEITAHHPPTSSKDFLSDFEAVLHDTHSRGKLEKVFNQNETVEENSSFEDEILRGTNKLIGSEEIIKPRNYSFEDDPEFYPIRSNPPESFSSSSKNLFDDDNAQPLFQMKPNGEKFDAKEEVGEEDEDEHSKGHPSLEDENGPWRAPIRGPLDSTGESLSHPVCTTFL